VIVKAHRGNIYAENNPDGGGSIHVLLPKGTPPVLEQEEFSNGSSHFGDRRRKIQIRRILKNALEDEGCLVSEASTVKEGLRLVGTSSPELVMLDLGLPDGDGIRFIEEVRGWSDIPILILSARFDEEDKIAGLNAGADDYLTKPFGVGERNCTHASLIKTQISVGG
jgi:CheY-like chemotaxis protein